MRSADPEPKRTVAYYLPADLIDWIKARARARRTNASYEAEALLRLARMIEGARPDAPAIEEKSA